MNPVKIAPFALLLLSGAALAGPQVLIPCALPSGDASVVGVKFSYGTSPGVYNLVWEGKKGPVPDCTQIVTNMEAGKTYYVVAQSYDATKTYSALSNEIKIVVPKTLPVPVLTAP